MAGSPTEKPLVPSATKRTRRRSCRERFEGEKSPELSFAFNVGPFPVALGVGAIRALVKERLNRAATFARRIDALIGMPRVAPDPPTKD
jgi:hypothetical protein